MGFNDGERITVTIDQAQANAALKGLNTGFETMEQRAVKASRGSSTGMDQLAVASSRAQTEVRALGVGGIQAIEGLETQVVALATESVVLRNQLIQNRGAQDALNAAQQAGTLTNQEHSIRVRVLAQEENRLEQSLRKVSFAHGAAARDLRTLQFQARDTAQDMQLLAGSLGVRLPAGLASLAARIGGVQRIMQAAFSATVWVAFASVAIQAIRGVADWVRELGNRWNVVKRTFEDQGFLRGMRELVTGDLAAFQKTRSGADKEAMQRAVQTERQIELIGLGAIARIRKEGEFQRQDIVQKASEGGLSVLRDPGVTRELEASRRLAGAREGEEAQKEIKKRFEERWEFVKEAAKELQEIIVTGDDLLTKTIAENTEKNIQALNRQNGLTAQFVQLRRQGEQEVSEAAIRNAELGRDQLLRQVELAQANATSIQERIALEGRRAEIEIEHAEQVHQARMGMFRVEEDQKILLFRITQQTEGVAAEIIAERVQELEALRDATGRLMDEQLSREVGATRENAAIRQAQIIRSEQERTWQSLKRSAEGVLDALLDKSTTVWQAIANTFRATMLTAIKDVASSWIANILMPIFGGGRGGGAGGGFGGGLGTAGALGGIIPGVFGGGGFGLPGIGPGGTAPTFPVGTAAGIGAGLSLAGLGNFIGIGGRSAVGGIGPTLPFGAMSLGGQLSSIALSPAAGIGGGLLLLQGVQSGGRGGVAMGAVGGALLGAQIGSFVPGIGTAIGAGVGAIAGGLAGLFGGGKKKPEEVAAQQLTEARREAGRLIEDLHGVRIHDNGIRDAYIGVAMSQYGGSLPAAVMSQWGRETALLYGMTTSQNLAGLSPVISRMNPVGLVQRGGQLYEEPFYLNGILQRQRTGFPLAGPIGAGALERGVVEQPGTGLRGRLDFWEEELGLGRFGRTSFGGGRASLDRIAEGGGSSAGGGTITLHQEIPITLDGEPVRRITLDTIIKNGRVVSESVNSGLRASAGRRQMHAALASPGTLV